MKTFYRHLGVLLTLLLLLPRLVGAGETLAVPTIMINPDIYYPLDEILYVEGRSATSSVVELRFSKSGSKPRSFTAKSDQNGEWVLAEKVPLEAGDWEVRARVKGLGTPDSDWSNPRVFKVVQNGVTIGGINVKFAALSLVIFVILIIGIVIVLYFSFRVRRLKNLLVAKELREAHESVREGLAGLRGDILEELRLIGSSGEQFSPDKIARKEHLLKELERIEKNVEREISDVEDKIN